MFRFLKLIFLVVLAFLAGKMMAEDTRKQAAPEPAIDSPVATMARLLADEDFKEQNPAEYRRLAALALMFRARTLAASIPESPELES